MIMPHEWNNILVVTKDELVPKYYTWEQLKLAIWRNENKPYGIKRVQRACNNRPMLVSFDSLPVEIQEAIGDPRKVDSILERYYEIDPDAVVFFTTVKVSAKGTMEPEAQEECIINASVLQAAIRLKKARELERVSKSITIRGIMATISSDVNGFNKVLSAKYGVTHTLPSSASRFEQKYKDFQENGYQSLIGKKYNNRNAVRNTYEIQALLEGMFISQKHKPTPTEVARQYDGFLNGYVEIINNETGELYNPKDFKKLSQRSITAFLASWGSKVATYKKRAGNRQKYMDEFTPYEQMEHVQYAGAVISIDDRQPPFNYEPGKRIWFYNGVDLGSECLTAWVYGKSKEGIIIEFYRQMVRNYAEWNLPLPYELECESSLNSSFKDTFLRDGAMFKKVRVEANNARLKRCERYWGNIRYGLEKKREGWIARPQAKSEANQVASEKRILIPYNTLVQNCLKDIQTWNNMPHSIYKDKTRWEVFLENQHPDNTNTINYKAILPHLGYKTETSCKKGQIRLDNGWYLLGDEGEIQTGDELLDSLRQVEGKEVDIYWLDDNDGKVLKALVFLRGGSRCICEAIAKPVTSRSELEQTPEQKANRTVLEHYRNTVDGYATRRKNSIDRVTVIDNRPVTLNNGFKIRGLDEQRSYDTLIKHNYETEILLPSPEEQDDMEQDVNYTHLNNPQTSFKKSFAETF